MNDDLLPDLLAAVEQQLNSLQTLYVATTFARLRKLGLSDEDAKTQIALCLGAEMDRMVEKSAPFDEEAYRTDLDALPLSEEESGEEE